MTNVMHIDKENNNNKNNMNTKKSTSTTSKIVDPKVSALNVTFDRNLGQWPNFLAHMSNLNFAQLPYYHIQQQQQQQQLQTQHKYQQHQRNFFNSNYQYQCAMRMSTMLMRKQQQQQQQQQQHELLRSHLHLQQQQQQHQQHVNNQQQHRQQQREHQQTQQKRKQKQKPKQLLKPQQQQQQQLKHKQLKNIAAVVNTVASVKIVTPTKTTKANENATTTSEIIKATEEEAAAASSSSTTTTTTTTTNETITTTTDEPATKSNDTMQRNGSKASHNLKSHKDSQQHHHHHHSQQQQQQQHHHHHQQQQQNKNDSSDSGVSSAGHHQAHGAKQRKTRGAHKRQQQTHMTGQKRSNQATNSGYSVDEWLGRDVVYCYERRFMTSSDEDNLISHHNAKHRNSTSSDTAGSDDTISSSSNDDISAISASVTKPGKKSSNKTRQSQTRRQQKRKQQNTKHNNNGKKDESNKENNNSKPEDDMFYMGGVLITSPYMLPNSHPNNYYTEMSSIMRHGNNIDGNLRMQCTRTAAMRADNHHWSSSSSYSLDLQAYNSLNYAPIVSSSSSTSSSPIGSPIVSKRHNTTAKKEAALQSISTDFGPVDTLNMSEHELAAHLSRYLMDPNYFRDYGYPVESRAFNGMVEILKPGFAHTDQNWCSSGSDQYSDSGRNSGNSSPASMESDSSEVEEITEETMAQSYHKLEQYNRSIEKECARCKRIFHVTEDGEYLNQEGCVYHWGKIVRKYSRDCGPWAGYTCCQRTAESTGCSRHSYHVWSGAVRGLNGPYTDYVNTVDTPNKIPGNFDKVFAMDCEMSYTGRGLEVTKITVIGHDGAVAYEHFVRPEVEIVDYNTRFSGVTEKDLNGESHITVKSLTEVQSDLLELFDTNTILIGHALENDFRGLRIMHKAVIDTSITFPHASGFPYKLGLKSLAKRLLNRDIQTKDKGHCSYEDSRTCLDLMLHKLRSDLNDEFNCLQH